MTTVAAAFGKDELAELDQLRRRERTSRSEAIRIAVRWYARWADRLPNEDLPDDETAA